MKLIVNQSKIGGKGSFAPNNIKAGSKILTFRGEVVTQEEINRRIDRGEERVDNPLQIDDRLFLDLNDNSLYINHSCDPNCSVSGQADLVAIRNIKKGEELTFDYSATVGKNIDWLMDCHCGAENCRRKIGNVLTIPKEVLDRYYQAGGLQTYIRRQLGLQ